MPRPPRAFVFVALAACAGCGKPADISQARREHLLAEPHGWIDVVVQAPPRATDGVKHSPRCLVSLAVDGESMLVEDADLFAADAAHASLGYRLVAPVGALKIELHVDGCVAKPIDAELPLPLEADHLAALVFDGRSLAIDKMTPYAPTTLDAVREELARLHDDARDDARDAHDGLRTLTRIAVASLALNAALIAAFAVVGWRRRRATA